MYTVATKLLTFKIESSRDDRTCQIGYSSVTSDQRGAFSFNDRQIFPEYSYFVNFVELFVHFCDQIEKFPIVGAVWIAAAWPSKSNRVGGAVWVNISAVISIIVYQPPLS